MIYLQDHRTDDASLRLRPGSHRYVPRPHTRMPSHISELVLHPSLGDVIVFDSRLFHAGQEEASIRARQASGDLRERMMMGVTYGRVNEHLEHFEVCHAVRNELHNNPNRCFRQQGQRWLPSARRLTVDDGVNCSSETARATCGGGSAELSARRCG